MKANELLTALRAAASVEPDKIPDGFKTAVDWAKEFGASVDHTRELLNAGAARGLMMKKRFRAPMTNGSRPLTFYATAKK